MIGERLDKAFLELEAQVSRVSGKEYYALYAHTGLSLPLLYFKIRKCQDV